MKANKLKILDRLALIIFPFTIMILLALGVFCLIVAMIETIIEQPKIMIPLLSGVAIFVWAAKRSADALYDWDRTQP